MSHKPAVLCLLVISIIVLITGLVGCGQNGQPITSSGATTSSTSTLPTATFAAGSIAGSVVAPQPVSTGVAQNEVPGAVATTIALATSVVESAATAARSTSETAVAVATVQAYLRLTPTLPPPKEVGHGDFGVWSYKAYSVTTYDQVGTITHTIAVHTKYDYSTLESMFAYAKANQGLADQLAAKGGKADLRITFRSYVAPDQFRSWARANGLKVHRSTLRVIDQRPEYARASENTVGIGATDSGPLPQDRIDNMLKSVGNSGGITSTSWPPVMRGVYFTVGTIDAKHLPKIAADPLVFVADVTINIVRNELKSAGVLGAEDVQSSEGEPAPFFWDMEHKFGLDKFKK